MLSEFCIVGIGNSGIEFVSQTQYSQQQAQQACLEWQQAHQQLLHTNKPTGLEQALRFDVMPVAALVVESVFGG